MSWSSTARRSTRSPRSSAALVCAGGCSSALPACWCWCRWWATQIGVAEQTANALLSASGAGGLAIGSWVLRRGGMSAEQIARRTAQAVSPACCASFGARSPTVFAMGCGCRVATRRRDNRVVRNDGVRPGPPRGELPRVRGRPTDRSAGARLPDRPARRQPAVARRIGGIDAGLIGCSHARESASAPPRRRRPRSGRRTGCPTAPGSRWRSDRHGLRAASGSRAPRVPWRSALAGSSRGRPTARGAEAYWTSLASFHDRPVWWPA